MSALVYDMQGRVVLDLGRFQTDVMDITFRKTVPSHQLPNGMYNLVLFDNRKRYTTKIIKS